MGKVRVRGFAVSIDGFGAGPDQGLAHPLGKGGPELMQWFFPTRTFRSMVGKDGGTEGTDDRFARAAMGRLRRLHPRPQYVRPDPRRMAGRRVEGLVGRQSPVSRSDLHPDPPPPGANRDG